MNQFFENLKKCPKINKCLICNCKCNNDTIERHLRLKHCTALIPYLNHFYNIQYITEIADIPKIGNYKNGTQYIIQNKSKKLLRRFLIESSIDQELDNDQIVYHLDNDITNSDITNIKILPFLNLESKSPKKNINSRRKGRRKESDISNILELWWGNGIFRPTPQSGAWDRGEFKLRGDIVSSDNKFPFSVEVKNEEEWRFSTLLNGGKTGIKNYWIQSKDAAATEQLIPIIIFTRNYHPNFIGIYNSLYQQLNKSMLGFKINIDCVDLYITLLDEFLKCSRTSIIKACRKI